MNLLSKILNLSAYVKGSDNMARTKEVSNALCISLNEAIYDESKAPKMYEELIHEMSDNGVLTYEKEQKIRDIILQEKDHKKTFIRMASELRCSIK